MTHGTYEGYRTQQCRCDACKAWKVTDNERNVTRSQFREPRHGTSSEYRYGCRCDDCREAKRGENAIMNPRRTQEVRSERSLKRPKSYREYSLKAKYGLTLDDYEAMCIAQDGKCAICFDDTQGKLVVDHCHESGRVRELLCHRCNVGLGFGRDSPDLLRRMADYVERHRS